MLRYKFRLQQSHSHLFVSAGKRSFRMSSQILSNQKLMIFYLFFCTDIMATVSRNRLTKWMDEFHDLIHHFRKQLLKSLRACTRRESLTFWGSDAHLLTVSNNDICRHQWWDVWDEMKHRGHKGCCTSLSWRKAFNTLCHNTISPIPWLPAKTIHA